MYSPLRSSPARGSQDRGAAAAGASSEGFAYHAVPTNFSALGAFHNHIKRLWMRTLRRRSPKDRTTWERIKKMLVEADCRAIDIALW